MSVLPILPQGFVVGRILTSRGDSADADKKADTAVVVGVVIFTPATAYRKLDSFTAVTHSRIAAELDSHGDLHPKRESSDNTGSDTEDGIWLPVGTWKVTYLLDPGFGELPEHNIEVTEAHTEETPLPLFANMGDAPQPGASYVTMQVPLNGKPGHYLVLNGEGTGLAWGNVEVGVGGGAVSSVAGRTGDVVLSSADLTDAASLATDAELSSGLATKADAAHEHTSTNIVDWAEAVQDTVAEMLVSGANVTLAYDDAAGKVTVTAAGGDAEAMRDTIGAALVGVGGVSIAINDAANTITLSISGLTSAQISDSTETGRSVLTAANANAARNAIDAAATAHNHSVHALTATGTRSATTYLRGDNTWASPATQAINAQTGTAYTLQAADAGKLVTLTNAAAITLTVPGSVFTAGQRVDCLVLGTGMVTAVGSGATVHGTPSLASRARYSTFTVLFTSATTAIVVGDLA